MTALSLWHITFYVTFCFRMCKTPMNTILHYFFSFFCYVCSCFEFWTHILTHQGNGLPEPFLPSVLLSCACIANRPTVCIKLCFLIDSYQSQLSINSAPAWFSAGWFMFWVLGYYYCSWRHQREFDFAAFWEMKSLKALQISWGMLYSHLQLL